MLKQSNKIAVKCKHLECSYSDVIFVKYTK